MSKRIIVDGYHHSYCKKLIDIAANKLGSVRKVSFAIGLSQAQLYRYYHNECKANDIWIKTLEQLCEKLQKQ